MNSLLFKLWLFYQIYIGFLFEFIWEKFLNNPLYSWINPAHFKHSAHTRLILIILSNLNRFIIESSFGTSGYITHYMHGKTQQDADKIGHFFQSHRKSHLTIIVDPDESWIFVYAHDGRKISKNLSKLGSNGQISINPLNWFLGMEIRTFFQCEFPFRRRNQYSNTISLLLLLIL